jgi:hypothetical protein
VPIDEVCRTLDLSLCPVEEAFACACMHTFTCAHSVQEAYIAGEQHVINDVFRQIGTEDAAVRTAFQDARDKMSNILEAAIEKQEEQEKTAAVDAERKKHWIKPERVDDEMRGIYKVLPVFILQAL